MHSVVINGQYKNVASSFNELSQKQILRLMPIVYGDFIDKYRQQIEVLCVLLGINQAFALRITPVQYCQLLWLTDFLLSEQVALTKQPLPWVRPEWYQGKFYGPADELNNISFLEFAFADAYFVAYCQTQEPHWLDQLLGTLYRPERAGYRPHAADYGGDRRAPFNENLIERHAARLARLPEATKLLVFTWYRGCRHALEQRFPLVFTPATEATAAAHPDGWAFVLREMSGQAFGAFAETGRQPAHQLLAKMHDDLARAEQLAQEEAARQRATH